MQVETTSGVYISGAAQFAGLTFSNPFTGTVKRTTGTAYAKGNGEGTNFKRYYEINNTTGSALVANCDVVCVTSGANDETNGVGAPYFEYNYQSAWNGYGDGSTGSTIQAAGVSIPNGNSDLVFAGGIGVTEKIFLQGPYNASSNDMNTTLNADVPMTSLYTEDTRTASAKPALITGNNVLTKKMILMK